VKPLVVSGLHKHYGGVRALRGANLSIAGRGVVHGLVGENGAGKSTMLKILSGQIAPDSGSIRLGGEAVDFNSPAQAISRGVVMVSQEISVAPHLSVAENVLLGRRLVRSRRGIDWRATDRRAREILHRLELDYEPRRIVGLLRPDQQQMVEIARALSQEAHILILDEPTSSLTDDHVQALFRCLTRLKADGLCVLFVSHRLNELFEITDEVTVLRDGHAVASGRTDGFDLDRIVAAMVGEQPIVHPGAGTSGREPAVASPGGGQPAGPIALPSARLGSPPALRVHGLLAPGLREPVDLEARSGEIVGIAGLVGAGRSILLESVFGERRRDSGEIEVDGERESVANPRQAIRAGIGFVPAERKTQGLVLSMSVRDNLLMAQTMHASRFSRPGRHADPEAVADAVASMRIKAASLEVPVETLSGGNQQKVVLAKWLLCRPRVLLLDEPTRGVDVGAKADIHTLLRELAAAGMALVVSSSEYPELLELCTRIIVMYNGKVVAELASSASEATLARHAGGGN
jgi:ABC-type sugar transport system ATPase subunit